VNALDIDANGLWWCTPETADTGDADAASRSSAGLSDLTRLCVSLVLPVPSSSAMLRREGE
jgi:hypothetical protein